MPIELPPFDDRLSRAVAHYWRTLAAQKGKQKAGTDHGNRSAVTGGKQMDGFCELVEWLLVQNGLGEASIYVRSKREIPGFFRATKDWDMIVVHEGHLIAAVEFKSQRVPPLGCDTNARIEEAIGMATKAWTAFRNDTWGIGQPRPWLGLVMLYEDRTSSASSALRSRADVETVRLFPPDSYGRLFETALRRFGHERLFDAAAFLASSGAGGVQGTYVEPAADLTMNRFLASLMGHVGGYLALVNLRASGPKGKPALPCRRRRGAKRPGHSTRATT